MNKSGTVSQAALCDSGETTGQELGGGTNQSAAPLQCLLCGGLRHRPIFHEFGVDILRCCECHHVFSSFAANPYYDGFWGDEVQESECFYWNEARRRMHEDFFRRFVAGRSGRLLDMGCGLGFFLKAMTKYGSWEAYGCEISVVAVRYARKTLGLQNVICSRPENAAFPEGSFDIVTMWDVIDHILHPEPLLRRCHALLRQGGICFIRTPNVFVQLPRARLKKLVRHMQPKLAYLMARDHLHHYSMRSIRTVLERNGLSRVKFTHLHPISNSRSAFIRGIKNVCFEAARALALVSSGQLNFDNLFVVAQKE